VMSNYGRGAMIPQQTMRELVGSASKNAPAVRK
jgi:hypothetical protein